MNCRATWELAEYIVRPCKNDFWIRFEDGEGDETPQMILGVRVCALRAG